MATSETTAEGGHKRRFLAEHSEDGTFRLTFKADEPDDRESTEQYVGSWSISGAIYFTTVNWSASESATEAMGKEDTSNVSAYEILEIDDKHFEYESFSSRAKFAARRVDEDFGPNDL